MAKQSRKQDNSNSGAASGTTGNESAVVSAGAVADEYVIDPAAISASGENSGSDGTSSGDTAAEPVRKRRGRKPGSKNKTNAGAALDISGLEIIFFNVHLMLASITKTAMLNIDKQEAHMLAEATSNVARHYDVQATEKTVDWINLFMAIGAVYGPRMIHFNFSRKERKAAEKQPEPTATAPAQFFTPAHVQ